MDGQNTQPQDADTNVIMIDHGQNQLILNELPPPDTKRWVVRRKAAVVSAVKNGAITLEEVCGRYGLSVEEFSIWQEMIEKHGVRGLRVTKLQEFRTT
jgi:hypothetical protein